MITNGAAALACKSCCASSLSCCSNTGCVGSCLLAPTPSSPPSSSPPSTPSSSPHSLAPLNDEPATPPSSSALFGVALTRLDTAPGTRVPTFVSGVANFLAANFGRVWPTGGSTSSPPPPSSNHVVSYHQNGGAGGSDRQDQLWRMVAACDDFFFPPWGRGAASPPSVVLLTPASLHSHMACAAVTALQTELDAQGLTKTLALRLDVAPERQGGEEGDEGEVDYATLLAELMFCVFLFLEKLPHALVPHRIGDAMIQTRKKMCCTTSGPRGDEDCDLLQAYKNILVALPPHNYHLFAYLLTFLRHLWQLSRCEANLMENLVTAFSSTVYLGSEGGDDIEAWWLIVRALLIHSDSVFPKELQFIVAPKVVDLPGFRKDYHPPTHHIHHQAEHQAAQFVKIYKGEKALILPFDQILLHSKSESPTPPMYQSRSSPDFKASPPRHHHRHHHPPLTPHDPHDSHRHHHAHHHHPPQQSHPSHRHVIGAASGLERSRSQPSSCCAHQASIDSALVLERLTETAPERRAAKFYFGPSDEDPLEALSPHLTLVDGGLAPAAALVVRPRLEIVRAVVPGRLRLEEIMTRFEELSSGSSGNSSLISSIASSRDHRLAARASTPDLERSYRLLPEDKGVDAPLIDSYAAAGDAVDHHAPSIPRGLSSKRGSDATLVNADFFHSKIHLASPLYEQQQQAAQQQLPPGGVSSEAADDLAWLEKHVANGGAEKMRLGYSWRVSRWANDAHEDSPPFMRDNQSSDGRSQTEEKFNSASRFASFYSNALESQLDHKDLPPPSPPATHHAYRDFFENGIDGASFHSLHQKLQTYEKKLKHYEEMFERENGYKPFAGSKETMYEIKKYNSKIEKVKKELKGLKGKYRPPPSPSFSEGERDEIDRAKRSATGVDADKHKPRRHSSPCDAPDPSPHLTLLRALQAYMPGAETLGVHHFNATPLPHNADATAAAAVKPTFLNRETLTRLLEDLNPEVLWKQKVVLQKVLLHFERVHGKPTDKTTIDLMRPLYCKYRRIKNILAKYSPRHPAPELPTIIEGHQWDADSFDTSITSRGSVSSRSSFYGASDPAQNDNTHHNRSQFTGCVRSANRAFDPDQQLASSSTLNVQRSKLSANPRAHSFYPAARPLSVDPSHPVAMGTMETSSIHSASLQELLEERRKIKAIRHRYKKLAYIPVDLEGTWAEGHPTDLPEPVGAGAAAAIPSTSASGGVAGAAGQQRASTAVMKRQLKMYNYDNSQQFLTSTTPLLPDHPNASSSPPAAPTTTTKRAYFLPNLEYYETYKMAKNKLKLVNALIAKLENKKSLP